MIARMSKYNFVLFAAQSEDFVEKLRGLGADIEKVERVPAALEQAM